MTRLARSLARWRGLGLAVTLGLASFACERAAPDEAGAQAPASIEVRAAVTLAPVADDHPYVIALLTALSIEAPAGVEARLDGRTEAGGRRVAEPLLFAERRESLVAALGAYEREHPRPPELGPVYERVDGREGSESAGGWQLHFIELGPDAGGFVVDRAARAQLVAHALGSVVELELSPAQRDAFARLTEAEVGHRVAIVIDDEAVAVPVVREPIVGGRVQVWPGGGEGREAATQALLERLARP